MTLQQMEYIVAIDKYRHFIKAAQSCNVSQSTLSMMVKKLEDELDTIIFDREAHPIRPTAAGEKIISQAKVILFNADQLKEMTVSEKKQSSGDLRLAVIPTVSSYIIPKLIGQIKADNPSIALHAFEMQTCDIIEKLQLAELDMALMATPLNNSLLLEIPVYYEKLHAYVSPEMDLYSKKVLKSSDMPSEGLWMLKEGHCLRNQVQNFCGECSGYTSVYEAGSIDSLIRIVDENGGYTIVPELHEQYLCKEQKRNVRKLADPEVVREISLVIRRDYVRERILNDVAGAIKKIIPEHMIDTRLKKFAIKI